MQTARTTIGKRLLALICSMALLVSSMYFSGNFAEAEESATKAAARTEYTEIVEQYSSAVSNFEKNSEASMYTGVQSSYTKLDNSLKEMKTSLEAEKENIDYNNITNLYTTIYSTLSADIYLYNTELEYIKSSLTNTDDKAAITIMIKEGKGLYTSITNIATNLRTYTEKYSNNKTYSDGVEILIDYYGGVYNNQASLTLNKLPGEEFGIISPTRTDCVFSGWQVLSGDTKVELKNGSYTVTVGTQSTVIRAIWKTADGQDAAAPTATATPTVAPTAEPTATPAPSQIDVTVSFEGGTYNGQTTMTQKVVERNTIVLFENVDLIRKEGYKVASFTCGYGGTCKILDDKRVLYTAPAYSTTKQDLISVVWEKYDETTASASPAGQNTVYVDLSGGCFTASGKQADVFYVDTNTTKTLFTTNDVKKDGYTLQGFNVTDGVKCLVQDGDVILLPTDYIAAGVTLTAVWVEKVETTPTVAPTIIPNVSSVPTVPTTVPTTAPTQAPTAVPTAVPTAIPTAVPTQVPTAVPTTAPTQVPTQAPIAVPTATPKPVKITLERNTITLGIDEGVKVKATATQNAKITYESEDTLVCGVTEDGTIIGRKAGMTQVLVKAGGKTKKINVCVMLKPTKLCLTSNFKTKATYTLKKGKTKQLMIYFYKNSYSNKITFKSSNKKIATVTSKGKVKAKKKGKCKITVKTYNGKKAVATIKVK